ncbi:GcvT family protein [Oceanibacterium hippocampi]|uniref:GcvT family protein n=1 Tax=Oceanibacterium hippocampi TaxID=745714 RepID=UPI000A2717E8|nr:FAD-dependent oxidoreductase [Oceanibacterium hippocampi]
MKSHARVVVIGGGVVGASVLYHLTRFGWHDVVLVERAELTSGSTWHAAGGMHTLNSNRNLASLQKYTIDLYNEIEEKSGQSVGLHRTGLMYLAASPDRLDYMKAERAKARFLGLDLDFISMADVERFNPLVDSSHFIGALYDPNDGNVDPSGVTHAYAKAARQNGAEVYRHNRVTELVPTADGGWRVVTEGGTIECEVVVNAGGLWAREVGHMAGVELPILPWEHQYLITEAMPEIEALDRELVATIDFEGENYTRQEGKGFLIGTYEQGCVPWSRDGTPWDFGHELLPADLDRLMDQMEVAYRHYPALANAGIKRVINGAMVFAPDGNPLIGPVPGLRNHFAACGVMAGFSQGGGVGLAVAEWIIEGEPPMDVFAMDVARFGGFATKGYTHDKSRENYQRRFSISFPNEELPGARPQRTTPAYDRLKDMNAVFGQSYGLEHALWFAPAGTEPHETPTFRRSNAFEVVAGECHAIRDAVGLLEIANFAKYEIAGPDAEGWLDGILANRLPKSGRMLLSPMLSPKGRIIGDLTVARLADDRFMLFGSGAAEAYHLRWFRGLLPDAGVTLSPRMADLGGFAIAGPKARELLARLCPDDLATEAFPFLHIRETEVANVPALVARISYTGELGYEIYVRMDYVRRLLDALLAAGADLGIRPFGGRALNSVRFEKNFGAWTLEFTPDYGPRAAGLDRFVDFRKSAFIGREAALAERDGEVARMFSTLVIEAVDADASGNEPVFHDGRVVGFTTSGAYGHRTARSYAHCYIPPALRDAAADFEVEILGERRPARLALEPVYDPTGAKMRQ